MSARLHGQAIPARDSNLLAQRFLVGLATPNHDPQSVGHPRQVVDLESDQLGAPECTCKPKRQERTVPLTGERVRAMLKHFADQIRRGRWRGEIAGDD